MRILITGATGYIGGAIAAAASRAGHDVLGVAHDGASRRQLEQRGFTAVEGTLADPRSLALLVRRADAVIHAAMASGSEAAALDRAATEAMVGALEGGRRFVYTSGVWVLGWAGAAPADERSPLAPIPLVAWRADLEGWLANASRAGAHVTIVRPGVVFGHGGGIPGRIASGALPMVGDGRQRWAVVHVDDLARLYVAAVERGTAGAILHGVAGVTTLAELVAGEPAAGARTVLTLADARGRLGDFAEALAIDQNVSSALTRAALQWQPREMVPRVVAAAVA